MTNIDLVQLFIGIILLFSGFMAVNSKKMIDSIIYLSLMSMVAVVSFVILRAPDIAITEAVIGSGLVTAVFLFTLSSIKKVGVK